MQMQQLRYFLEIAKEKNISAAAKNLYLSQPSLSQQIMKLEKELGIPLLIRHSKSISLTDAGEQFAHHAQRILGGVDQLSELMQKHSLLQTGNLKIGLLWIAGYLGIFEILEHYRSLHPGLTYSFTINGSSSLQKLLLERSLHAAFIISTEDQLKQEPELYYRKVEEDYYVAVVSKKNPLSAHSVITVNDLRNQPIIMPAQASAFRQRLDQIFEKHSFTPHILCETSQSDLVVQLASNNFGIGFSSNGIASRMQDGSFRIIPLEHRLHRSIYYVTLKELLDYPSIRSLTSYLNHYPAERNQ